MTIQELFVQATRNKFRFNSQTGLLTVEQLWDLPLTASNKANLDAIAVELNHTLKSSEESFVSKSKRNTEVEQKLEIVKYVIEQKMAEAASAVEAKNRAEQRTMIRDLIAQKEQDGLKALTIDELRALEKNL